MADQQQQFIAAIAPKAQEIQKKYGVPASIAIAQAALESGFGEKAKGNNLFGIKAGSSWHGATIDMATHEYINGARLGETDKFRAYSSMENSMENYGQFLATNARYAQVIGASGKEAADALQRAGYATDPKYAAKLKSIINTYDLTRFDDASYQGYMADDERFNNTRKRLNQERTADPQSWENFFSGFIQMLFSMFSGLTTAFNSTPADQHTDVPSPPRTPAPAPTQVAQTRIPVRA